MKNIVILLFLFAVFSCNNEESAITGKHNKDVVLSKCIAEYLVYYDSLNAKFSFNRVLSIKEYNIGDTSIFNIYAHSYLSSLIYDSVYYCAFVKGVLYCSNKKYINFSDSIDFYKNVSTFFPKEYEYFVKHKKTLPPEYIIESKRMFVVFLNDSLINCQFKY